MIEFARRLEGKAISNEHNSMSSYCLEPYSTLARLYLDDSMVEVDSDLLRPMLHSVMCDYVIAPRPFGKH